MPIPCISWMWSPIRRSRGIEREHHRIAAQQEQDDRGEHPGEESAEHARPQREPRPRIELTAAGRSTWWAKNMPPTQTTAERVCRISAIVATVPSRPSLSRRKAGLFAREAAEQVEHAAATSGYRIIGGEKFEFADRARPLSRRRRRNRHRPEPHRRENADARR